MSAPAVEFDPFSDEYFNDPAEVYRRLRDEAPVYFNERYGFYALSRFADVVSAHRDWQGFSSAHGVDLHSLSDAERTSGRASSMGFVFQAYNLIPVFSAVENVELPALLAGIDAKDARRRAQETLERVGLGNRAKHRPGELSGGEQQRVTVARALAGRPRVVWADEPTGALDSDNATRIMDLLGELNAEGLTLILITHDEGVGSLGSRLVRMRDGRIVSDESTGRAPDDRC